LINHQKPMMKPTQIKYGLNITGHYKYKHKSISSLLK
jgi:hypothetical protein